MLFDGPVPFTETRSYTSLRIDALTASAVSGGRADVRLTGALEACAGLWARGLSVATIEGDHGALTPMVLSTIGRELCRNGQSIFLINVGERGVSLTPVYAVDFIGGPGAWNYRVQVAGPTMTESRVVTADQVLDFKYAADPSRPWLGVAPWEWCSTTSRLAGSLENQMADVAGGTAGTLLTVPGGLQPDR